MTIWADFIGGHMDGVLMPLDAARPTFYANKPIGWRFVSEQAPLMERMTEPVAYIRSERRVRPSPTGEIVFRYRLREMVNG